MGFDFIIERLEDEGHDAFFPKFIEKELYVLLLRRFQHPAINGYFQINNFCARDLQYASLHVHCLPAIKIVVSDPKNGFGGAQE